MDTTLTDIWQLIIVINDGDVAAVRACGHKEQSGFLGLLGRFLINL